VTGFVERWRGSCLAFALFVSAVLLSEVPAIPQVVSPDANGPTQTASTVPPHAEFVVEVNKLGQVVRVESSNDSSDPTFNAKTRGNVLQMWAAALMLKAAASGAPIPTATPREP
jgi:hypothetical protein